MRTEHGRPGGRRHWRVALRGWLAVALLVVTTAALWHEHSAAHALDQDETGCVIHHAAQGFGNALASTPHTFAAPGAATPAPCAVARAPHRHRYTRYTARGPPLLA
jgi:hypothetical protein